MDSAQDTSFRPHLLDSVVVMKEDNKRYVLCFCGDKVNRSIVPHMKKIHPEQWFEWVTIFVNLQSIGYSLKKIMHTFRDSNDELLFSWTVIEREIRSVVESGLLPYSPPPIQRVAEWEPPQFEVEKTTVWDFPKRGTWAVHSGDYRGNWPPQLVRNLILKYTKPGDIVLDPFMGGGTTLIEAWLLQRFSIGVDISKLAYSTTMTRIEEMKRLAGADKRISMVSRYKPKVIHGDSTTVDDTSVFADVQSKSINLLCIHPPYLNVLKYTNRDQKDLSSINDPIEFFCKMVDFAKNYTKFLAPDNTCAVLIGDVRRKGRNIPLSSYILNAFLNVGYVLMETIIKTQNHERSSQFYSTLPGSHLLAHEYLYILKWPCIPEST